MGIPRLLKTVTRTTASGVVDVDQIRQAFGLPDDAQIFIRVPSGGDYSGMNLVLDGDTQIEFSYTVEGQGAGPREWKPEPTPAAPPPSNLDAKLCTLLVWIVQNAARGSVFLTPWPEWDVNAHSLVEEIVRIYGLDRDAVAAIVEAQR